MILKDKARMYLKILQHGLIFIKKISSFGIGFGIGIGFGMQSLLVSVSVGSLPKLPKFWYRPKFRFRSFTNYNHELLILFISKNQRKATYNSGLQSLLFRYFFPKVPFH
jgi:hypothetical protein